MTGQGPPSGLVRIFQISHNWLVMNPIYLIENAFKLNSTECFELKLRSELSTRFMGLYKNNKQQSYIILSSSKSFGPNFKDMKFDTEKYFLIE